MNILVATLGSYGDVHPMVGIAVHLKKRGHNVTLFTNAYFEKLANKNNLNFVPIGSEEDYDYLSHLSLTDISNSSKRFSAFLSAIALPNIRTAYDQLKKYGQPAKTVIVTSPMVFASRLIQEKFDIPAVTVHISPVAVRSTYKAPKITDPSIPDWMPGFSKRLFWWIVDKAVIDRMICPKLNAFRKEISLPPINRVLSKWAHSSLRVICLFPDWFAVPQPDWPPETHLTGFPLFDDGDDDLSKEVVDFLEAGEPPIVFSPGSFMRSWQQYFEASTKACGLLVKRGVLLSPYNHQIPANLPKGMRHFKYVPFRKLLPHAAALVHHGGIGSCAQAMRAGIPQLIHPMAFDQYDNAARLLKLGVGDSIKLTDFRPDILSTKLQKLTNSPSTYQRCRIIAGHFENISPLIETCELIESII
ncbi:glycosyltransferase [Thermodesulfobacteriota bacterium]